MKPSPTMLLVLAISIAMLSSGCGGKRSFTEEEAIVFQRVTEPREGAFSVLIPIGWQIDGGIIRVDPSAQGGPAQSIAAKVDFTIKRDAQGTVMMRWLPDVMFFDPSRTPAGQMGLIPQQGGMYQGMKTSPVLNPAAFVEREVVPYAHPSVSALSVGNARALPGMTRRLQETARAMAPQIDFRYDAAAVDLSYTENGVPFEERIVTAIEDWGRMGAGMWANKETFLMRAPKGELAKWEKVFSVIQGSVQISPQWLAGEMKGQQQRSRIALDTQRQVQNIDQEIVEHRRKTNAEIHNDVFLTLTDQEEYKNPYTGEVETGSNQWKHRWVNESGEVIYTDQEEYDPNLDERLKRTDFKRTPVRERFPQ